MASFTQLPGTLDLVFTRADDVTVALDFDRDITGYTLSSAVYVSQQTVPLGGGVAVPGVGQVVFSPTVTVVSAAAGTVTVSFPTSQTSLLSPLGTYRWYVRWVASGMTRTVVSGSVSSKAP